MAICKNCGINIDDSAKFCINCGTPVSVEPQTSTTFCTNCGSQLTPGAKFCTECGTAVKSVSAPPAEAVAASASIAAPFVPPVVPPKPAPATQPIVTAPAPPTASINKSQPNNSSHTWIWIVLALLIMALIAWLSVYFGNKKSGRDTDPEQMEIVTGDDYYDSEEAPTEEVVVDTDLYSDDFLEEVEEETVEVEAPDKGDDEGYFSDRVSHVDVYGTWNQATVNVDVQLSTSSTGSVTARGKAYYNDNFAHYYTLSGNGTSNDTGCDLTLYEYSSIGTYTGRWEGRVYKTSDGKVNYYGYFYNQAGENHCYFDLYSR